MMQVVRIDADATAKAWPLISQHLDRLFEHDPDMKPKALFEKLVQGDWTLWSIWTQENEIRALVAVSIHSADGVKPFARVEFMEGPNRREWLPYLDAIEEWAVEMGCDRIEAVTPKAFMRDMPNYRQKAVLMERYLA